MNRFSCNSLCCTSIKNDSVTNIVRYLKETLEILDIYDTDIEYTKILELKSMQALNVLNWCPMNRPGSSEVVILKRQFPHCSINEHQTCTRIASPCQSFEAENGLWDIQAKQLRMFRKNYWK